MTPGRDFRMAKRPCSAELRADELKSAGEGACCGLATVDEIENGAVGRAFGAALGVRKCPASGRTRQQRPLPVRMGRSERSMRQWT